MSSYPRPTAAAMDAIAKSIAKHGKNWSPAVNKEMQELHEPLHATRIPVLGKFIVAKGIRYGPNERHRIDVYAPTQSPGSSKLPVVVYFHGGAFVAGDNDITERMHGHIAEYFANNKCVGCLATYRLVPEARYPSGAEDVAASLRWIKENIASYNGDPSRIFALGQSAGGAHLASSMFMGLTDDILKGAVLLSASLTYDLTLERRRKNMIAYCGTEDLKAILDMSSVALFRKMERKEMPCEVLVMLGEYDFDEIVDANLEFVQEHRKKFGKLPLLEVMKGHNHISYALGIGLDTDCLGPRILEFVRSSS